MGRYLIVDDNRAFAENLAEILEDSGHQATVATAPARALELLQGPEAQRFDAVISDMKMPQMSGAKLLHEVRKVDPDLPAVVLTAFTGDQDLRMARAEGLLCVLQKPVDPQTLTATLKKARRGALVAVIEDDPAYADNLTEALRTRGFATVVAASVLDTEKLGHLRPCAAVADVRVSGGKDGEAMVRFAERFPDVPIFVVTAHEESLPVVKVQAIHRKPFPTEKLLEQLEQAYAERRA